MTAIIKILRKCILLSLMLFIHIGTREQNSKYQEFKSQVRIFSNSPDSIRIPKKNDKAYTYFFNFLEECKKQLKIPKVEDSIIEFNSWLNIAGMSRIHRLINIRFSNNTFSAELIKFEVLWNKEGPRKTSFIIKELERRKGVPKSGWEYFSKTVFSDNFSTLFDLNKEGNDRGGGDGEYYFFELKSFRSYWLNKFWSLFDIIKIVKVENEARRIIKFMEQDLSFSR